MLARRGIEAGADLEGLLAIDGDGGHFPAAHARQQAAVRPLIERLTGGSAGAK
jgi:hypothetical protein